MRQSFPRSLLRAPCSLLWLLALCSLLLAPSSLRVSAAPVALPIHSYTNPVPVGTATNFFSHNAAAISNAVGLQYFVPLVDGEVDGATLDAATLKTSATFSYATVSTVPYLNGSKQLVSSAVTPTELGYLSGVSSALQTQLNAKLSVSAGVASGLSLGGTTYYSGDGKNNVSRGVAYSVGLVYQTNGTPTFYPRAMSVDTVAQLSSAIYTDTVTTNAVISVRGYWTADDGGGGLFSFVPRVTSDSGTYFNSGASDFSWRRSITGTTVDPRWWGAVAHNTAHSPYWGEAYSPAMPGTNDFTVWIDWQVPNYSADTSVAYSNLRLSGGQDQEVLRSLESFGATNYWAILVRSTAGSSSTGAGAGQLAGANPFLAYQGTRISMAIVRTNGSFKVYRGTNDITSGFTATNPSDLSGNIGNGETTGVLATSQLNRNLPVSPVFAIKWWTNAFTLAQLEGAATNTDYVATVASANLVTALTNSGPALQSALNYAASSGLNTVQLPGGYFLTGQQLNIPPGVNVLGHGAASWNGNRSRASAPTKVGFLPGSTETNVFRVDRALADFAQANLDTVFGDGSYGTNYYYGGAIRNLWLDASPSRVGIPLELYKVSNFMAEGLVLQQDYGSIFRVYQGNAITMKAIYTAPSLGLPRPGLVLYTADAHFDDFDYAAGEGAGLVLYSSGKNSIENGFVWNQIASQSVLTAPTVDTGADTIAATSHTFFTGMPVRFVANGGTLPSPLAEGTTYWCVVVDANTLAVNTQYDQGSAGGALQGVKLNLTTAGSGSWLMRPFTQWDGNLVIVASDSVRVEGGRYDQAHGSGLVIDQSYNIRADAAFNEAGWNGSSTTPAILISGGGTNLIDGSQMGKLRSSSNADVGILLTNSVGNVIGDNTFYNLGTEILIANNASTAIRGTSIGGGALIQRHLSGTKTWDPGSASAGSYVTTTVTVTGATVGGVAQASLSTLTTENLVLAAVVSAADTVTVTLFNPTGSPVDLSSGTLRASVWLY